MKVEKNNIEEFKKTLKGKGYRYFNPHYKNEDYGYWKSFHIVKDQYGEKEAAYQIAVLMYDFTKYPHYNGKDAISLQLEFILNDTDDIVSRMDMSISSDNMTVEKFEEIAEEFYQKIYLNYTKQLLK